MITTTQIEDLLERNWNITSLVRNHISFMNPPEGTFHPFEPPCSWLILHNGMEDGGVAGHHQQLAAAVMNPAKF